LRPLLVIVLAILALGCREPEPEIRPVSSRGEPRARLQPRSAEVVSPEIRVRQTAEQAAAERERLGLGGSANAAGSSAGGGGGGGGAGGGGRPPTPDWINPTVGREPNSREVEAYRRELAEQAEQRIDPEADPCDQLRGAWTATANAVDRTTPEGRSGPPGSTPSRAELRQVCRQMPPGYLQCMDRTYFDEHRDECQREIQRLARRGQRISDDAQTQLDEIEQGVSPDPAEPEPLEDDG